MFLCLVVEKVVMDDVFMISLFVVLEGFIIFYVIWCWCGPDVDFSCLQSLCCFALLCVVPPVLMLDIVFGLLLLIKLLHYPFWQVVSGWISVDFFGIIMVVPALYLILVPRYPGLLKIICTEQTALFALLLIANIALFGFS